MSDAPRTTAEAMAFLRAQHASGTTKWKGMCLSLQRQARGLPPVYPSALAAAEATPKSERVAKVGDLRRGMIGYCDDPRDSNPFAHIFGIAGWDGGKVTGKPEDVLTWTNDARPGRVDLVRLSFFKPNWGDTFQFGATWLNGYDFSEFDKAPKLKAVTLGENYEIAIEKVAKAYRVHKAAGHVKLAAELHKDLQGMRRRYRRWSGKHS